MDKFFTDSRLHCPIDATMELIEGRWKSTILCKLAVKGNMRFGELNNSINGISSKVLTSQLNELQSDGLVFKEQLSDSKYSVYGLTDRGKSMLPILKMMAEWGSDNLYHSLIKIDNDTSDYYDSAK